MLLSYLAGRDRRRGCLDPHRGDHHEHPQSTASSLAFTLSIAALPARPAEASLSTEAISFAAHLAPDNVVTDSNRSPLFCLVNRGDPAAADAAVVTVALLGPAVAVAADDSICFELTGVQVNGARA